MHIFRIFAALICISFVTVPLAAAQKSFGEKLLNLFSSKPRVDDTPGLRRLAAKGNPEAQHLLFVSYRNRPRNGAGPEVSNAQLVSRKEAEKGLRAAAKQNYQIAIGVLGSALQDGYSVRRDLRAAIPLLSKYYVDVTDKERALVAYRLGDLLLTVKDATAEETARGHELIEVASAAGYPNAARARADIMIKSGDKVGARAFLEGEAKKDNTPARTRLARMLIDGTGGTADVPRGIKLLEQAFAAKYNWAGVELAREHLNGGHQLRNPAKAMQLMAPFAEIDVDVRQQLVRLLQVYRASLPNAEILMLRMKEDEQVGEPEAAWNLLRLLGSYRQYFRDDAYVSGLISRHEKTDQRVELWGVESEARAWIFGTNKPLWARSVKATLSKLIDRKMAAAFTQKGKYLRKGIVYAQDDVAATAAFLTGAELGDPEAMVELGEAYGSGAGIDKDPVAQLKWWRKAAAGGSLAARKKLIWNFSFNHKITLREGITDSIAIYGDGSTSGFTGPKNTDSSVLGSAFPAYPVAALVVAFMDGFRASPTVLDGSMNILRRNVPKKFWASVEKELMEEGFFKGPPDGYFGPDARAAMKKWIIAKGPLLSVSLEAKQKAANKEKPKKKQSAEQLAFLQVQGKAYRKFGEIDYQAKNYKGALKWFKKGAVEIKDPYFFTRLGQMYLFGHGVDINFPKARYWFEEAAYEGHAGAMYNLGDLFRNGNGVNQNYGIALQWFLESAALGYSESMYTISLFHYNGTGIVTDKAKGFEWMVKSAENGLISGMYYAGQAYYSGNGVAKDFGKAFHWLSKAAENGNTKALLYLAYMYETGNGVVRSDEKAAEFLVRSLQAGNEFSYTDITERWAEHDISFRKAFQRRLRNQGRYDGPINGNSNTGIFTVIKKLAGKS